MKTKLSELRPNEFKKHINKGKLNQEQVDKIRANLDELGLMGSIPVYEHKGRLHIIAGHHRVEALKQEFGKDFEVEVVVHNYSEDQVLRGMIVENLSQRAGDYREEESNVLLIRDYLQNHSSAARTNESSMRDDGRGGKMPEPGSVRQISEWLNKNGTVLHKTKIASLLKIADKLSPALRERVGKASHASGGTDDDIIPVKLADSLARVDTHEEQEALAAILTTKDYVHQDDREKALAVYKNLTQDEKAAVLEGKRELSNKQINIMGSGEMALKFDKKATELVLEMRTLRKTLTQFRKENLYLQFSPVQRRSFYVRLGTVKKEYGDLVSAIESSMEVLNE